MREETNKINSYKDLIVWQRAMELVVEAYKLLRNFPKEEIYGITAQMKRSVISVPSNIAEGKGRGTRKDYRQFLLIAYGSCSELETQIEIAKRLGFAHPSDFVKIDSLIIEVMKMLYTMIEKLKI